MNLRVVFNVLGALLVFLGLSHVLPLAFSLYYGDADLLPLAAAAALVTVVGALLHACNRRHSDIHAREAVAIVSFGWIASAAAGALSFCFYSAEISFTDAYFEVMSGFTTTGASIFRDVEILPHGLLMWRSLTHWLGGMGIIVLSLAILPTLGVGGMQLFKAEVPGPSHDKLKPRVQETAKLLWGVYVLLSAAQTLLLLLGGMSLFDALCHTFSTMATGGFSTRNASMAAFASPYLQTVVTVFMLLAGVNFALHYHALHGRLAMYVRDTEWRFYLGLALASMLAITLDLWWHLERRPDIALLEASFQTASILTTTGFATADFEQWPAFSQGLLVLLMLVGGSAGSTGGGIKVVRVLVLAKYTLVELKRLVHPNAIIPVRLNGRTVPAEVVSRILGFTVLYLVLLLLATLLLAAMGVDLPTAISAAIATLGNIGPGLAGVGPTDNYGHLPIAAKWLLSFCMLLGRLELFTVLVIFSRDFWKK